MPVCKMSTTRFTFNSKPYDDDIFGMVNLYYRRSKTVKSFKKNYIIFYNMQLARPCLI